MPEYLQVCLYQTYRIYQVLLLSHVLTSNTEQMDMHVRHVAVLRVQSLLDLHSLTLEEDDNDPRIVGQRHPCDLWSYRHTCVHAAQARKSFHTQHDISPANDGIR